MNESSVYGVNMRVLKISLICSFWALYWIIQCDHLAKLNFNVILDPKVLTQTTSVFLRSSKKISSHFPIQLGGVGSPTG